MLENYRTLIFLVMSYTQGFSSQQGIKHSFQKVMHQRHGNCGITNLYLRKDWEIVGEYEGENPCFNGRNQYVTTKDNRNITAKSDKEHITSQKIFEFLPLTLNDQRVSITNNSHPIIKHKLSLKENLEKPKLDLVSGSITFLNNFKGSVGLNFHSGISIDKRLKMDEQSSKYCQFDKSFKRSSLFYNQQICLLCAKMYSLNKYKKVFTHPLVFKQNPYIDLLETHDNYNEHGKASCEGSTLNNYQDIYTGQKLCQCKEIYKIVNHDSNPSKNQCTHFQKNIYKCDKCCKVFDQCSELTIHQSIHIQHNLSKSIDLAFANDSALHKHQRIHTGEKHRKCKECDKTFHQSSTLKKLYKCKDCDRVFKYCSTLTRHQRIHTGEKPYKCEQCGKAFTYSSTINQHQRIHTGEKPFQCKECGKAFNQRSNLTKHQKIHTGEKPFQCKDCGKVFYQNSALNQHQKIHTGEKPYKCKDCGGEKPYKCKVCNKTFHSSSNLINQHQKIHTGEKPFQCKDCGKVFYQNSALNQHQKIHTGEKPYKCTRCGKAFNLSSSLTRHQKIHT
ncbi:Zinc finger protein 519 [Heterocephalus glaber]|uniref:Zinc finger protein 519 n=1 Tax=Heterocephalus glaber TaxID=10181 RepID=G5BQ39_HETGA|nr:Zinc finger protein 519 [Heterocephalus glaber]